MSRNYFWRTLLIVGILAWAVFEIYPPLGRGLAVAFRENAVQRDETFKQIVTRVDELQKANPDRQFANVTDAVGTNDITRYFPFYPTKTELNPTRYILDRLQRDSAGKIKFGLDLQGGTSFLVGVDVKHVAGGTNAAAGDTNAPVQVDTQAREAHVLSQAVEVLRKRVDKFGVAEPIIQPAGNDRILIQLPGVSEEDKVRVRDNIQKAAFLEFRMVHEQSDQLLEQGLTEPGYEVLKRQSVDPDGKTRVETVLVKRKAEMTGKYIKGASVSRNLSGQPEIDFKLTSEGADIFATLTKENVGRRMAIVLDGELYSAPVIQTEILTGSGQITGNFTDKEAFDLAGVLENPLEAPVNIIESREVDPSLGKDTIASGMRASLYGIIAVAGFMLVYYMLAGFVADIALMLNVIILLAVMCSFGTTLTLPGIAGVVLTIGMAVDANVLIFERIREELAAGKSMRGALSAGYGKAFSTILDSHVTTLISSIVLIVFGNGPVKGFGVTLTIGVALSLFTALVITRLVFDFLIEKGILKSLKMWHLIPSNLKLDFMKFAMPAFLASWTLIAIGNGFGIYRAYEGDYKHAKGVEKVCGVDFAGGDQQIYTYANKVEADQIRKAIEAKFGEATIAYQRDIVTKKENLRITTGFDTGESVKNELQAKFPDAKFMQVGLDKVGATVGAEITQTAIIAASLALFGILIYVAFRYEFSFAVGAVIAIIHDILMTMGWFFLTGRQLNAPIVAAVLTIIGFSINDTVVIFDRIREDLKLGVRGSFKEIINQALNQTLSRTIITSGTVFLATLSLYLFGGGVINDFAFTFLVGIITGTYSSIYIASFIVFKWHKGQRPAMAATVNIQSGATGDVKV